MTALQTKHSGVCAFLPQFGHPLTEVFAKVFVSYESKDAETKEMIASMVKIINNPKADDDTRTSAIDTLTEILFAQESGKEFGVDLEDPSSVDAPDAEKVAADMDREEGVFAANLRRIMAERKVSQKVLAEQIEVGQPAISMMLNRHCRPQRATVEKLAKVLNVAPKELWPKF